MMVYLIFIMTIVTIAFSLTTVPGSVCNNDLLTQSGSYLVDTTPTYLVGGNINELFFQFGLNSAQPDSSYLAAVSIQQISYKFKTYFMNFTMGLKNRTQSSFTIQFQSSQIKRINILSFKFLIISSSLSYFAFDYITVSINSQISWSSSISKVIPNVTSLNITGGVNVFYYMTGFAFSSSGSVQSAPSFFVSRLSSTSYTFSLNSLCIYTFYIYTLSFLAVTVNTAQANTGLIRSTVTIGSYYGRINTTSYISSFDSVISGIYNFHLHNKEFSFKNIQINSTALWFTSISSTFGVNYIGIRILTNRSCCQSTLYFFTVTNLCYDICPFGTYANKLTYECCFCPYDCENCNATGNGNCISCNADINYRIFNVSTNRCSPLPGYYDTINVLTAQPCSANCIYCLNNSICLTCDPYFNLSLGICQPLPGIINNCGSTYLSGSTTICSFCNPGYILTSNTCPQNCGDGLKLAQQNCDDGNTANGDGCSVLCKIQIDFYCVSSNNSLRTSHCCQTLCQTCISAAYCILCYNHSYMLPGRPQCSSVCPTSYFPETINRICQHCPYLCLQCNYFNQCQRCSIGIPVSGGCSNTPNCIQVTQPSILGPSWCIACSDNQIVNVNFSCVCLENFWKVTGFCTNVIGCIGTNRRESTVVCIGCDMTKNFTLFNNTCNCVIGYSLEIDRCEQICGDGRIYYMECDDGNIYDGDGCSSACEIENGYRCFNGSSNHSSQCFYLHKKVKMSLLWADKTEGKNQGIFTFKISPNLFLNSIDPAIKATIFQCMPITQVQKISLQKNILTVVVNYQEDLQNNQAHIMLSINNLYFIIPYLELNFTMKSRGTLLIIYKKYDYMTIINKILQIISIIVLALFLVGSLTHKMMGVQLINTFQLLLFAFNVSAYYTQPFMLFKYLNSVDLNFNFLNNQMNNYESINESIQFNPDNLLLSQIIILLVLCSCLLGFLFKSIYTFYMSQNVDNFKSNSSVQSMPTLQKIMYNRFIFPFSIGFIYLNLFAGVKLTSPQVNCSLNSLFQIVLIIFTSLSFFIEWKHVVIEPNHHQQNFSGVNNCRSKYVVFYLFYIYCVMFVLFVGNRSWFCFSLFGMMLSNSLVSLSLVLFFTIVFFFWFVCHRPYKHCLHNFGQMVNFVLIISFISWCCLREQIPAIADQQKQIKAIFIIVSFILISLFIHISRIVFQIKRKCKTQQIIKKSIKHIQQQQIKDLSVKLMHNLNPYYRFTQKMESQIQNYNQINKERLQKDNLPLFGQPDALCNLQLLKTVGLIKFQKNKKESKQLTEMKQRLKKQRRQNILFQDRKVVNNQ